MCSTRVKKILRSFKPDVVVGFGGYASAPVLWAAQGMGVPTVIQEQNSYAGLTNKLLARRARRICVAYEGMERFFAADKITHTGNPLRGSFSPVEGKSAEALEYYGLRADMPTILVVGGSLGTRTLNEMMKHWITSLDGEPEVQVVWQTGKFYEVADVVISRSGACTVSELCLVGKPTLFVPSPNVAEDHQTKNAMALVDKDAAVMVRDADAVEQGMPKALGMLADSARLAQLKHNITRLGIGDAAERVVRQIEKEWCKF
jgi:UDP-N-acetylglucosamine--N-acetylmuramyl-(pentapeptide) pyrophosphoryl-undecaprenol N-acetylglucosamine transferase